MPAQVAAHLQNARQNLAEQENLLQTHRAEIQKVREEMNRTHRLYIDGQITAQDFGQFYKPAEERLNQLLAELPRLEAEVAHLTVTELSVEDVTAEAERLYTQWPQLPFENKHSIIESIVEKVTIGKGEIDLSMAYMPSSEPMVKSQRELRTTCCPGRRRRQEAAPKSTELGFSHLVQISHKSGSPKGDFFRRLFSGCLLWLRHPDNK